LSQKKLQVRLGSEDLDLLAELVLEEHEICILNFNQEEFLKWFIFDHENYVVDVNKPLDLQNFLKPLISFQSVIPHYSVLKGFVMKHLSTFIMETPEGDREIKFTVPEKMIKRDDLDNILIFIEKRKDETIMKVKNCLSVANLNGNVFEFEFNKILRKVKEREAIIINKMQQTITCLEDRIKNIEVQMVL